MLILVIALCVVIISLFVFPRFSPIPYFPSSKKDTELILKALSLKDNQIMIDLGAGDGWVLFEAAKNAFEKKLNTRFIALEINPVLFLILVIKRFRHQNKNNIQIVFGNMFSLNYKKLLPKHKTQLSFYLYISPWHLEKTIENIKKYRQDFTIISYMYKVPNRKEVRRLKGKNNVYVYKW